MATLIPDTLYLRGKASHRRRPARPEVSLCLSCLQQQLEKELSSFPGHVIAFEPDGAEFTQSSSWARANFPPPVCSRKSPRPLAAGSCNP